MKKKRWLAVRLLSPRGVAFLRFLILLYLSAADNFCDNTPTIITIGQIRSGERRAESGEQENLLSFSSLSSGGTTIRRPEHRPIVIYCVPFSSTGWSVIRSLCLSPTYLPNLPTTRTHTDWTRLQLEKVSYLIECRSADHLFLPPAFFFYSRLSVVAQLNTDTHTRVWARRRWRSVCLCVCVCVLKLRTESQSCRHRLKFNPLQTKVKNK